MSTRGTRSRQPRVWRRCASFKGTRRSAGQGSSARTPRRTSSSSSPRGRKTRPRLNQARLRDVFRPLSKTPAADVSLHSFAEARGLKVAVIGGGPAGLYFGLLLKKARPEASITGVEG